MTWNMAKLESERTELLDVIRDLRKWERFAIDDRQVIALSITAHMMRLSALEEEIATRRGQVTVDLPNCA